MRYGHAQNALPVAKNTLQIAFTPHFNFLQGSKTFSLDTCKRVEIAIDLIEHYGLFYNIILPIIIFS